MTLDQLLGTTVAGKYRLDRLLGQGGMGVVFEAVNVQLGRRVALKRLRPGAVHDSTLVARFHQEARAAAAIGSDHIVDVLDIVQDADGAPWIVMELLVGESLAQRLVREKRLAPDVAVPVLLQVLSGLAVAHARGVVHRDLKPENLFLEERPDGTSVAKLLDFGISKIQDQSLATTGDKLTATGVMMGTAHYMSPEQARGRPDVDHRTDLYSAGAILYESLAGQTPFSAGSYNEMIAKLLTEDPPPIASLVPDLPERLAAAIDKAMARDREQRFQSAGDMQDALAVAMDYPSPKMTPAPRVVTPKPSVPSIRSGARAVITPTDGRLPETSAHEPTVPVELARTALEPTSPPTTTPTPLHGESSPPTVPDAPAGRLRLVVGAALVAASVAGSWFLAGRGGEGSDRRVLEQRGVVDAGSHRVTPPPPAVPDAGAVQPATRRLRVVVSRPATGARIRIGTEEHAANEWTFDLPGEGTVRVGVTAAGHREKVVDHDPRAGDLVVELAPVRASPNVDDDNPYRRGPR